MADDIVTRLRALSEEWWECCNDIHVPLTQAAAEIERLRTALALAVGELTTHGQYAVYSPDQLMQQFLEEARRG